MKKEQLKTKVSTTEETTLFLLAHFYPGQEPPSEIAEHYRNLDIEELLSLVPQGLADKITHISRVRIEHIVFEYKRLSALWSPLKVHYTETFPPD